MLLPPKIDMNEILFGSLRFIRANPAVFRKYYFLPLVIALVGLFVEQIPMFGMVGGVICQSTAMALISVSVTRFYFLKDAVKVAEGAEIPYARVFFLTFVVTAVAQLSVIFPNVPDGSQSVIAFGIALYLWINLKIVFTYPALACDEAGSVMDLVKRSYRDSTGHLLKIIFIGVICYIPAIFFLMMLSNFVEPEQLIEDFWGNIPHFIFMEVVLYFCIMWFTLAMARLYEAAVIQQGR